MFISVYTDTTAIYECKHLFAIASVKLNKSDVDRHVRGAMVERETTDRSRLELRLEFYGNVIYKT